MNESFVFVVSATIFLLAARTDGAASENVGAAAVRCRDGDDCFIRSRCFPASVCKLFDGCMEKNQSKELCEQNAVRSAGDDVMKAGGIRRKRFVSSRMRKLILAKKLANRRRSLAKYRNKKRKSYWNKKRLSIRNKKKKDSRKIRWGKKWEAQVGAALRKSLYSMKILRSQLRMLADIVSELRSVKGIVSSIPRGPVKYHLTYSFLPPKKEAQVLFTLLDWQAKNKGAKDIYRLADRHKKILTKYGKLENESVFHFLKRKNVEMTFRSPFTPKEHAWYKKMMKRGRRQGWLAFGKMMSGRRLKSALKNRNQYTKTRYHQVKTMLKIF